MGLWSWYLLPGNHSHSPPLVSQDFFLDYIQRDFHVLCKPPLALPLTWAAEAAGEKQHTPSCGNKAGSIFCFPNTPEKCSLFVYRWCCASLEKELHFSTARWSPDGVPLGVWGPALLGLCFGVFVSRDSKILRKEQTLGALVLAFRPFDVIYGYVWSSKAKAAEWNITRAMPTDSQGRSRAAAQQSL